MDSRNDIGKPMKHTDKKGQGVEKYALLLASAMLPISPGIAGAADMVVTEQQKDAAASTILDEVVVRGEVINTNLQSTSATVLGNEDIVDRVYVTPLDMVAQAPGISIV
ncbi:MAG: hypothetical protein D3910_02980 [Candidatus Electrothrix sp. ATG2]|nr:hypothetical protein [Candidatus Electrothrix sp. ATG2]